MPNRASLFLSAKGKVRCPGLGSETWDYTYAVGFSGAGRVARNIFANREA
jgi:hypothetical protein